MLLSLIDQLPRATKYREALANDVEMAEAFMNSPEAEDTVDDRPPMSEDTQEASYLRDIANQLRLLRHDSTAMAGGNPSKPSFLMPPRTAIEDAEWRSKRRKHLSLVHQLLPHKREETAEKLRQLDS